MIVYYRNTITPRLPLDCCFYLSSVSADGDTFESIQVGKIIVQDLLVVPGIFLQICKDVSNVAFEETQLYVLKFNTVQFCKTDINTK